MAITKSIVDMMGGTISMQSELGKGSRFEVNLKLKIDRSRKMTFPFERVLLISDESDFIENAKAAFSSFDKVKLSIAKIESEADDILMKQPPAVILLGSSLGDQKLENHVHRVRSAAGNALLLYSANMKRESS